MKCVVDTESEVQSNRVAQVGFVHPQYDEHKTVLLEGVRLPSREVEEFEIYNVDRRFF